MSRTSQAFGVVPNACESVGRAVISMCSKPSPEKPADDEPSLWAPLVTMAVALVPGLVGLLTGRLLLFPSLGPSAVMQAHLPRHGSSRIYNLVVGHLAGLVAGDLCVVALGLATQPSVFELQKLSLARVVAAALALLLATTVEVLLRARHPPAAATTLLVALGSFKPTWRDTTSVLIGVFAVAIVGDIIRRYRVRHTGEARGRRDQNLE